MRLIPLLFSVFLSVHLYGQNSVQVIVGTISDKASQVPLSGVRIQLLDLTPPQGAISDSNGRFRIESVIPGRYDIFFSYPGYKEQLLPNVVVVAGKELVVEVQLEESVRQMSEVVVSAKKNSMNNELTTVSGRSFSMEDVNRYAGGRSDPARLAANFAGVSSPDDSRNDIVIRGNSPVGVLWRLEGLVIANPNHFSTIGTTGGPVSAINTNLLRNSDFMTSAFPAEYGNANAGVFDLGLRNGNAEKREHTFQFGVLTGIEFVTEGPLRKDKGGSYLFGYRYGFSSVAQSIGLPIGTAATPYYQDVSFKLNSAYTKCGKFTLFGIGALSEIEFLHNEIDTTDLFADPTRDSYFTSQIGLAGLKHYLRFGEKTYLTTILGGNYLGSNYLQDSINAFLEPIRTIENKTSRLTYTLNTALNYKHSSRLFMKTGVILDELNVNLLYRNRENSIEWKELWNANERTLLAQSYVHAKFTISDNLTLNAGIHGQYLTLNGSTSIEPRLGIRYQYRKSTFSAGAGLHSQMQPLDSYFLQSQNASGTWEQRNKELGFTKSQHYVLGYEITPWKNWRMKMESYFQYLFQVPIHTYASSYSMLNAGATYFPNNEVDLINRGTGTNYGLELTVEKYYSKGYYGLFTGSIYSSTYKGSDGIERNTAFNGKYVYNILLGKELKIGKEKRNALTMDIKFTQAGGRYYTPVDLTLSQLIGQQVNKGDLYAYTERYPDFVRMDVKIGFTLNSKSKNVSHAWFFDVNNITNRQNVFAERYNPVTNSINTAYQIGFFPNFVYRMQF